MILEPVANLIERVLPVRKAWSSIPGQVKPVTYNIDTYRFLPWCLALLGKALVSSVSEYCDRVRFQVMVPPVWSLMVQVVMTGKLSHFDIRPDLTLDFARI